MSVSGVNPIPPDGPGEGSTPEAIAVRGTVLLALTAMLLVLVGATWLYDKNHLPDQFFIQKLEAPARYDLVVVGNSRVYRGVNTAEVLSELYGRGAEAKGLNFGFSQLGLTPEILANAESKLLPNAPRKIMILGIDRASLARRFVKKNGYLDLADQTAWERTNALLFGGVEHRFRLKKSVNYISRGQADGFVWSKRTPENTKEFEDEAEEAGADSGFDQRTFDQVLNWVRSAKERGIEVYGVRIPTTERMYEIEVRKLGWDEAKVQAQFEGAGGVWISAPAFSKEFHSYDGSHLRHDGAEAFSRWLGRAIRNRGLEPKQ